MAKWAAENPWVGMVQTFRRFENPLRRIILTRQRMRISVMRRKESARSRQAD